jgi:hypothetical protein
MTGNLGNKFPHLSGGYLDAEMLRLWSAGFDTLDIARAVLLPEEFVYVRLPAIRAFVRRDQEWNFDHTRAGEASL